jgi:putative MATE family efflux protein
LASNVKRKFQNQVSWQQRLQYNFDNFMSKGGFSVFLALLSLFFGAFLVMTITRYVSEWLFPNNTGEASDLSWEVFVQLIGLRDTGDDANLATKLVGVVTIFVGLVLFSSLVAFITQEFESRLHLLRRGKSPVVEENHTLILGFSDRVIDILKELIVANESEADAAVFILSQQDKEEMDDYLRNNLGDLKTTRVVTRNGIITNLTDLNKVRVNVAKSVIIINSAKASDSEEVKALADARVVKAILAVVAANEEDTLPPMVVELHSEQYRRVADNIAFGAVTTLNEADILARILVQTSRNLGLAAVYLNLVGFEGNEFYFYRPEKSRQGISFSELPFRLSHATPIGIRHPDGTLTIKPSLNYQLADNDEVIVLAEDDSTIKFYSQPIVQPKNLGYHFERKTIARKPEKHLIIGWNNKTPISLREYAKYIIEGSQVNLVVEDVTTLVQAEFDHIAKSYPHINMDVLQVNLNSIEDIVRLKPYEYNSISILAGKGENAEEIDAKTLTILLQLRQIFRDYTLQTVLIYSVLSAIPSVMFGFSSDGSNMRLTLPKQYNFLPRFYRLSFVSVLSNMLVPLAGLVDTAFLGHLSDIRHLAGVILASILFDYLYRVLKFLRSGTNAITAQAVGADNHKAILLALLRSGLIALIIGLVVLVLQYPLQKVGFAILNGSSEVETSGVEYFYGRIWGAPAVLLNFILIGWFLGREMNGKVLLISLVANGSNVLLDYFMVFKWGWESAGAGWATAVSQYLSLLVGLIGVGFSIRWNELSAAVGEVFDWVALKETVALKGNILIRFLVLISTYALFTNLSSLMGTNTLAQNGLLLQIALLNQFTIQGVGMTTQTLTGNFKSKGATEHHVPLLIVSILTALLIALGLAMMSILIPDTLFGLLTNHAEVNEHITSYTLWLLPLLELTAVAFMLEAYFIGLKQGAILRNAALVAFGLGFIPVATTGWYLQNNHILWLALVVYMTTMILVLGGQLPKTFGSPSLSEHKPLPSP